MVAEIEEAKEVVGDGSGSTTPSSSSYSVSGTRSSWAHSSVSTFGVKYNPPLPDLSMKHSVEALVEGSDMSQLREGNVNPLIISHNTKEFLLIQRVRCRLSMLGGTEKVGWRGMKANA